MKKILFIAVALIATTCATAQTIYQNEWVSVDVNDTSYGTVTVMNPIITYDTTGDVIDTVRNDFQWMFFAFEKDSTFRFNCFIVEVFGDTCYTDTLFDAFYFFDLTKHDSLALHAYFYDVYAGIPEINDSGVFVVYPNPTGAVLNFNKRITTPLHVFDLNGKSVMCVVNSDHVDLSRLPKGMYVIRTKGYRCRVLKL